MFDAAFFAWYHRHMPTTAIKKQTKNVVTIPRAEYKRFLMWQKEVKTYKTVKPTKMELRAIVRGRKNLREGKCVTLEQLKHELASRY